MMKKLLLVFVLAVFSIPAFSQFQLSSIPETLIPNSGSSDIFDITCYSYSNVSVEGEDSDLYISTWSNGNGKGLYWKRSVHGDPSTILNDGMLNLFGTVHGAVILKSLNGSNYHYTVAVIHDNTLEFYEWDASGLNWIDSRVYTPNHVSYARIDAVDLNYYAVVWEDGYGNISSFGGAVDHPGISLMNANVELDLPMSQFGIRPDLAINRGSGAGGSGLLVYYTYIREDRASVDIAFLEFDELVAGNPTWPLTFEDEIDATPGIFPGFYYSFPKIDAPDNNGDAWAVVVYDYQVGVQGIVKTLYKVPPFGVLDASLNNGSLPSALGPFFEMHNSAFDSKPAVAFDKDGYHIHYAWGKTQNHSDLGYHDYLGLMLDPATSDAVLSASGDVYRIIDRNPDLDFHVRVIALSPQNEQTDDLFIVFEAKTPPPLPDEALYYKHVDWIDIPAIGYSAENPNSHNDDKEGLIHEYFPNPIENSLTIILNEPYLNDELWMGIYNIDGKQIDEFKGSIDEVNKFLYNYFIENSKFNLGFIQLKSLNSKKSETIKLIKQ